MLDTNAVILIDRLDPAELPAEPVITAVTLAELSVGPLTTIDESERAIRLAASPADGGDVRAASLRRRRRSRLRRCRRIFRRSGRTTEARAFDAMIAAVAIANGLPVYTCNPRDFAGIDRLRVHAIPHPDDTGAPAG